MSEATPSPRALLEQAESQAQSGDIATAIRLYRSIPRSSPQARKAQRALKSLQKQNPQAVMEADLTELISLHEEKAHNKAMALARQLARSYAGQPLPHNIMGTIHMARQQFRDAAKCFRRALDIAPDYLDARNNLGAACNSLEDYEEAIACFGQVVAARPGDAEAFANLGNAYRRAGQLDAAVRSYEASLSLRPKDAPTHLNLGTALMGMRQPGQAVMAFHNALELEPDNADTMRFTADAYREMDQYEEAIQWYGRAIEAAPDNSQYYANLGMLYLRKGERDEAARQLRKALELAPDSAETRHFLSAATGDIEEAPPKDYVVSLFDDYAARFDKHLVASLGYEAPRLLCELTQQSGALNTPVDSAIDLGCGTGLCGVEFRDYCRHLVGVDLSGKMLAQAEAKDLYDQLVEGDIVATIERLGTDFNLFICADTFIYVGELSAVFRTVADHAAPGALFTFSTESGNQQDVELLGSGRYAHSNAYIQRLAAENHFEVLSYEETRLRKERRGWLKGGFYLLRYPG